MAVERPEGARIEGIADAACAEVETVTRVEQPGEIRLNIILADPETQVEAVDGIGIGSHLIMILIIAASDGSVELIAKAMFPFEGEITVAVAIVRVAVEAE